MKRQIEQGAEMDSFSFYNPTRILFGAGAIRHLGQEMNNAGVKKCLLVAGGGSIKTNGIYELQTLT